MMRKFVTVGSALGVVLASVRCAPQQGDGSVRDAAISETSHAGTGGAGIGPVTDANSLLDLGAASDTVATEERGPLDAGASDADVTRDAFSDESTSPPVGAWQNGLGMRFVPVPGTNVMFSIWETRVQDYQAFAQATGASIPKPDFDETALQPKASVSRAEAEAFAVWLTGQEQKQGLIGPNHKYRLPADKEWDVAMEVGATGGSYPWGAGFPPPDNFANYGITNDGFMYTSPVGTFPPNKLGLYDMAGNLWEWIGEGCASGGAYLVRGCGWNAAHEPYFVSTFHYCFPDDLVGHHNVGFRVVLEGGRP